MVNNKDQETLHALQAKGIGPHERRELTLMESKEKPFAIISSPQNEEGFYNLILSGSVVCRDMVIEIPCYRADFLGRLFNLTTSQSHHVYLYALKDEEWRIDRYMEIVKKGRLGEFEHCVIGWLLGYSDKDIQAFLVHSEKMPILENKIHGLRFSATLAASVIVLGLIFYIVFG